VKRKDKTIPGRKTDLPLMALFLTILTALVILTYSDAGKNQFVDWDDFTYVVDNHLVREKSDNYLKELFTTPVASNFHPVTMLTLRLNNNECPECPDGISPEPYIRWNIILHLFNTILVFLFIREISKHRLLIAFLTAAVFAVHPMHVESVAWISERKDVLSSFFFLSGLFIWIRYRQNRILALYFLTFMLFLSAVLSKATTVVFPLILILVDFLLLKPGNGNSFRVFLKEVFSPEYLLKILPFFIVSLIAGIIAYRLQNGQNFLGFFNEGTGTPDVVNQVGPFSLWQKLTVSGYGFIVYLIRFFVPDNLVALNPYPLLKDFTSLPFSLLRVLSLIASVAIILYSVWSLRKSKLWFFSIAFYFITIALVLQFISVGMAITSNRYSYLPYIAVAFMAATVITQMSGLRRGIMLVIYSMFIVILILVARKQVGTWENTETLWSNVISKYPDEELPRRSRGKYYSRIFLESVNEQDKKKYGNLAVNDFNVAIKAGSNHPDVYDGAGVILASAGKFDEALVYLNKAIELDPEKGSAFYNRALVYESLGNKDKAIDDYTSALSYRTEKAFEIINNRSDLLLETGRYAEAERDLDYLITRNRNNEIYYFNRGVARMQNGDLQGAADDFRATLELKPDDSVAREQLEKLLK